VVYSKRPFGGPEHVLRYLGAYTHRVAISNHRLVALADGKITFRWRDSAHQNKKRWITMPVEEFLRRFLLHLLPRGFVRIRNFGFLAKPPPRNLAAALFAMAELSPAIVVEHAAYSQRRWHSLLLDLSSLWRTHESNRDAYSCADPASFSALTHLCPV
jgi:hypothetical protein